MITKVGTEAVYAAGSPMADPEERRRYNKLVAGLRVASPLSGAVAGAGIGHLLGGRWGVIAGAPIGAGALFNISEPLLRVQARGLQGKKIKSVPDLIMASPYLPE